MLHEIDRAALLQMFDYDRTTGTLKHGLRRNPRFRRGQNATRKDRYGYLNISIQGQSFKAHRVVWLLEYGHWPSDQIDHINGQRDDNRIENLREATYQQNGQNRSLQSNNKSGYQGVSWKVDKGLWRAQITVEGKKILLGYFSNAEKARDAYLEAKFRLHAFQPIPRNMGRSMG